MLCTNKKLQYRNATWSLRSFGYTIVITKFIYQRALTSSFINCKMSHSVRILVMIVKKNLYWPLYHCQTVETPRYEYWLQNLILVKPVSNSVKLPPFE